MTALSSYAERKVLDHLFKNTSYTSPNAYIGLFTTNPTDSASGSEVASAYSYARIQIDNKMGSATTGTDNSTITNTSNITFAAANGGSFGLVTHIGIFDNSTGGNLLAYGQLAASKQIDDGDTFQISTGNLSITID
jgi:hypothetical protein